VLTCHSEQLQQGVAAIVASVVIAVAEVAIAVSVSASVSVAGAVGGAATYSSYPLPVRRSETLHGQIFE